MSQQPYEDQTGPSLNKPGETPAAGAQSGPAYSGPQYGAPEQPGAASQGYQAPSGYEANQGYQQAPAGYPGQAPGYQSAPGYQAPPGPQGQPSQAYPPVGYAGAGQVSQSDAKTWSIIGHVGPPIVAAVSGGFLAWLPPLIAYLMYKDKSQFVRQHSSEALNFQITLLIAYIVCWVIAVVTLGIGAFLLIVPWILSIVFAVMGAMAANEGRPYRYPLNIRLVN